MSFTVCSPGCCLLRGPILLLSDKAALLFSLCNPLFIGKNRPKPSSLPPRLPQSPDITASSILFPSRSCSAELLCGSLQHFQHSPAPFLCSCHFFLSWKNAAIFHWFFPFHALPSHARLYSFIPCSHTLRQPTLLLLFIAPSLSLHRSCAVAFELKCCESVIRLWNGWHGPACFTAQTSSQQED